MKKFIVIVFSLFSMQAVAQNATSSIFIDGKPVDPRKAFTFLITKKADQINLVYKTVDSIGKITYAEEDLVTIKKLINKSEQFFDSLSNDSLVYFQRKLDAIRVKNTYYKTDSTTIYKTSHPGYWKLLEAVLRTPSSVLATKKGMTKNTDGTYCFFTLKQNDEERNVHIDELDIQLYPLLTKLTNESFDVIRTFLIVKNRKNN